MKMAGILIIGGLARYEQLPSCYFDSWIIAMNQ